MTSRVVQFLAIAALCIACGSPTGPYPLRLELPPDYSSSTEWPLLIYLHGASTRHELLHLVGLADFPEALSERRGPYLLAAPRCPIGKHQWHLDRLVATIDAIAERYSVDRSRIYLTGESQGGFGTWAMVRAKPDVVAAAVPVAGGGNPTEVCAFKDVPIWAFHGEDDDVVPEIRSAEMIEALRACGGKPRYTVVPRGGHGISDVVYSNEQLYRWLLSQTLNQ